MLFSFGTNYMLLSKHEQLVVLYRRKITCCFFRDENSMSITDYKMVPRLLVPMAHRLLVPCARIFFFFFLSFFSFDTMFGFRWRTYRIVLSKTDIFFFPVLCFLTYYCNMLFYFLSTFENRTCFIFLATSSWI